MSQQPTILTGTANHQENYQIVITDDFTNIYKHFAQYAQCKVVLVYPETCSQYIEIVQAHLREVECIVLPLQVADTENDKNINTVEQILNFCSENHMRRTDLLVAVGGGVICDIVGFAASVYARGIDCVYFPTTLLAQVDAAIGGKTGVNSHLAKNAYGTFTQPKQIITVISTLDSLPENIYCCGFGELVKYALLAGEDFYCYLESALPQLLVKQKLALREIVKRGASYKNELVLVDSHESNKRSWLNLGHTAGHAIEVTSKFSWRHGEAVACGLMVALTLSHKVRGLDAKWIERTRTLLDVAKLPTKAVGFDKEVLIENMLYDKKIGRRGKLSWILLDQIGKPVITDEVSYADFSFALDSVLS